MLPVTIVVAANNELVLQQNLLASPDLLEKQVPIHVEWGASSASVAYNRGLDATASCGDGIVIFVHQDVYLPIGFLDRLMGAAVQLSKQDPDWGVVSCFGRRADGTAVGWVWSSGLGRSLGARVTAPVEVSAVDELLLVIRRGSGLRFDAELPKFHCYAADLVAMAAERKLKTYVADIPVVHNSEPVRRLDATYCTAYAYMRRKWRHRLPMPTLVVPITKWRVPLYRARLRLLLRRIIEFRGSAGGRPDDPQAIAKRCGFEEPSKIVTTR